MKKQLVYDLPTRLFHALFALLFVGAFTIAKTVDDDSVTFSFHMLAGLTLSFLVLTRIVWGLLGTKHARFRDFALNPLDLIAYARGILTGRERKWAGHNPASSWVAVVMMALALSLGITGYFMATGYKEELEDIHEILANTFLVTALLHVAGVLLHSFRHRDGLGLSMLHGKKADVAAGEEISGSRPLAGLALLVLLASFSVSLWLNFQPQDRSLNFFGTRLQLGENEENEGKGGEQAAVTAADDDD